MRQAGSFFGRDFLSDCCVLLNSQAEQRRLPAHAVLLAVASPLLHDLVEISCEVQPVSVSGGGSAPLPVLALPLPDPGSRLALDSAELVLRAVCVRAMPGLGEKPLGFDTCAKCCCVWPVKACACLGEVP